MLTLQIFTPVDPFSAKPIRLRTATEADWAKIGAMPLPPLAPEVRDRPLAAVIAETVKRRLIWMPRLNEMERDFVADYTYGDFLGDRRSATVAEGLDDLLHCGAFLGFAPRRHNANFDEDVSYFYGAV